jgi:hypothetical protein
MLQSILKYHVVAGKVLAADVVKLTRATTLPGHRNRKSMSVSHRKVSGVRRSGTARGAQGASRATSMRPPATHAATKLEPCRARVVPAVLPVAKGRGSPMNVPSGPE